MTPRRCGRAPGFPSAIPVPVDTGAAIADQATALIGTPFLLHGREPSVGIDCVGLVALSLECTGRLFEIPREYALRGSYFERAVRFFDIEFFHHLSGESAQPGDILLCQPAIRQLHFAVITSRGFVHAHAGLRRVVLTPQPFPWPAIGHWRYIGD